MLPPTFRYLIRLHLRIAGRYVRRYHKEVALLILVLVWMDTLSANPSGRQYLHTLSALSTGAITFLSVLRKDRAFLLDVLPNPGTFLLLENLALALPASLVLLFSGEWLLTLSVLLSASALSQVKLRRKPRKQKAIRIPVPREAFEWIAGIRKHALSIVAIYAFGLLLPQSAGFPLLAIFFLAFSIGSFYQDSESTLLVDVLSREPSRFIRSKILTAWKLFSLLALPLIIMSISRIHSRWYVVPIVFVLTLLYVSGVVLMKYAYYEEGSEEHVRSGVGMLILVGSMCLPPLMLLYEFSLWRKIHKRLHIYRFSP